MGFGLNVSGGLISNMLNYQLKEDMFKYHKDQDAKKWELVDETQMRQDMAVQRKAADMEAAGLSKTLAAGGGAESAISSPSSQAQAPQYEGGGMISAIQGVANLIQQDKQIAQTQAQTELTKQTQGTVSAEEDLKREQLTQQKHNTKLAKEQGVPVGAQPTIQSEFVSKPYAQLKTWLSNKSRGNK